MPSTYSTRLRLELIANGEKRNTWGNITNSNLGTLLEEAIAGYSSIALSDANYTLSTNNGATDEARKMFLAFTGTLTATRTITIPGVSKVYCIRNATGQTLTIKTSGGTGVNVLNGTTSIVVCDGTDCYKFVGSLAGQDAGAVAITGGAITGITDLAIADGGTGASTAAAARTNLSTTGNLFQTTAITSSTTFNFHADTKFYRVKMIGGGGGGGSAGDNSNITDRVAPASGGGSGAYCEGFFAKTASTATVVIGAAGAGGTLGNSGSAGGDTTFNDGTESLSAGGGNAGVGAIETATAAFREASGARGSATGGNILNRPGYRGDDGLGINNAGASTTAIAKGGNGARTDFGDGGKGGAARATSGATENGQAGADAVGYGSGGGGACWVYTSGGATAITNYDGGDGAPGLVIVEEYR